jgi:20S proteasome subunit alpha 2
MSKDFSLTTFNSKGELKQIENALQAVNNGQTAIGICYSEGVVLITEKNLKSSLVDHDSIEKIQKIAPHIGATFAGLFGDFRVLMQFARKHSMTYKLQYEEPITVRNMTSHICSLFQEFTLSGGVRPFGVSILLAGVDQSGTKLFQLDPSGVYNEWKAISVGRNSQTIKQILERRYKENLDLDEAVHIGLSALKEKFEGVMNSQNVEISFVDKHERILKVFSTEQIASAIEFLRE